MDGQSQSYDGIQYYYFHDGEDGQCRIRMITEAHLMIPFSDKSPTTGLDKRFLKDLGTERPDLPHQ